MPCPKGVDIPGQFKEFNQSKMFNDPASFVRDYKDHVKEETEAARCVSCGACEKQCPQHLPIRDWLKQLAAAGQE